MSARRLAPLALLLCLVCARAAADVLVVTLLGTGSPRPETGRFGPAVLVEAGSDKLLFDAGRGVAQRVLELQLDFGELHTVFVTHLHYDHIIGLPDLLLSGWVFGRTLPLEVRGPAGVGAHLRHLERAYERDIALRLSHTKLPAAGASFKAVEIEAGAVWRRDGLEVTAFEVEHGVVSPAFGYRVDYRGRSVVLSGDTGYSEELVAHGRGADLLVHEIAAASGALQKANPRLVRVLEYHSTPAQVARVVRETKPRMTVLVHALLFGVEKEKILSQVVGGGPARVVFGEDRMAFDIGERLRAYRRPGDAGAMP